MPEVPLKPPNVRRLLVVGIVLLVVLGFLLFSIRELVREVIVIPVSYLIWVVGILVESTNQFYFWLVLLFISLMVASRSLRPKKKDRELDSEVPVPEEVGIVPGRGRVGFWAMRVKLMRLGPYYQGSFNEGLSRLLVEVLAHRHHLTIRQVEQNINNGTLDVPDEVRKFVHTNLWQRELKTANYVSIFLRNLWEWFLTKVRKVADGPESAMDPDVVRVIKYMEEELEVSYGSSRH
jgi:hypothetical protein